MKFKRVLLKLSGESLIEEGTTGISSNKLETYARQISDLVEAKAEVGIVIGGGNIFRGFEGTEMGFDRYHGDQMGMLATVINGLALQSALGRLDIKCRVFTAVNMAPVGEYYTKSKALEALESGFVCIFTFGTGNPYFTTDTAAALRAIEIDADVLLKGTRVDGVYTSDPEKDKEAIKYTEISFLEAYEKNLKIMDLTAFTMCMENKMPIVVFNINRSGDLRRLVLGENIGTLIKN